MKQVCKIIEKKYYLQTYNSAGLTVYSGAVTLSTKPSSPQDFAGQSPQEVSLKQQKLC